MQKNTHRGKVYLGVRVITWLTILTFVFTNTISYSDIFSSTPIFQKDNHKLAEISAENSPLVRAELRSIRQHLLELSTSRAELRSESNSSAKSRAHEDQERWREFIRGGIQTNPPWQNDWEYRRFRGFGLGIWAFRWRLEEIARDAKIGVKRLIGKKPSGGVGLVIGYGGSPHEIVAAQKAFRWNTTHAVEFVNLWGRRRVEKAARYLAKKGLSPKKFILHHANARDLRSQIPDESIDGIYAANVTLKRYIGGEPQASEIVRMLRPGGYAYISGYKYDYPVTDLAPIFEKHGKVLSLGKNRLVFQKSEPNRHRGGRARPRKTNQRLQPRSELRAVEMGGELVPRRVLRIVQDEGELGFSRTGVITWSDGVQGGVRVKFDIAENSIAITAEEHGSNFKFLQTLDRAHVQAWEGRSVQGYDFEGIAFTILAYDVAKSTFYLVVTDEASRQFDWLGDFDYRHHRVGTFKIISQSKWEQIDSKPSLVVLAQSPSSRDSGSLPLPPLPVQADPRFELRGNTGIVMAPDRDWTNTFQGERKPLVVHVGFANGVTILHQAQEAPHKNFIGIEDFDDAVGKLREATEQHGLTNLRVVHATDWKAFEAQAAIGNQGIISELYYYHPDSEYAYAYDDYNRMSKLISLLAPGAIVRLLVGYEGADVDYAERLRPTFKSREFKELELKDVDFPENLDPLDFPGQMKDGETEEQRRNEGYRLIFKWNADRSELRVETAKLIAFIRQNAPIGHGWSKEGFWQRPLRLGALQEFMKKLDEHIPGGLKNKSVLDLGANDLRVSLFANEYGANVDAVEIDSAVHEKDTKRVYAIAEKEGLAHHINLLEPQDGLDLDWSQYAVVFFYYTEPRGKKEKILFRERILAQFEKAPNTILAIVIDVDLLSGSWVYDIGFLTWALEKQFEHEMDDIKNASEVLLLFKGFSKDWNWSEIDLDFQRRLSGMRLLFDYIQSPEDTNFKVEDALGLSSDLVEFWEDVLIRFEIAHERNDERHLENRVRFLRSLQSELVALTREVDQFIRDALPDDEAKQASLQSLRQILETKGNSDQNETNGTSISRSELRELSNELVAPQAVTAINQVMAKVREASDRMAASNQHPKIRSELREMRAFSRKAIFERGLAVAGERIAYEYGPSMVIVTNRAELRVIEKINQAIQHPENHFMPIRSFQEGKRRAELRGLSLRAIGVGEELLYFENLKEDGVLDSFTILSQSVINAFLAGLEFLVTKLQAALTLAYSM